MDRLSDLEKKRDLTRAALTTRLRLLEERVRDSIEEAGETVKRTVNLQYQVKKRPLVILGCSALVGYFLGRAWFAGSSRGESALENGTAAREVKFQSHDSPRAELGVLKGALTALMSNLLVNLIKEIVPLGTPRGKKRGRSDPQASPESKKRTGGP